MEHVGVVSLLLRYTTQAWLTAGDPYLLDDLRVYARTCISSVHQFVRIKLPLRDNDGTSSQIPLKLFSHSDHQQLSDVIGGRQVTETEFHRSCMHHLSSNKEGVIWLMLHDTPLGEKHCTGGVTGWMEEDRSCLVITNLVTRANSNTDCALWLYLINLCDTRKYNLCIQNACNYACIRWPLVAAGFLWCHDREAFVRICVPHMVKEHYNAMVVAIQQMVHFAQDFEKSKKIPLSNISMRSVS